MGEKAKEFWEEYGTDIVKAAVGATVVGVAIVAVSRFIKHKRKLSSEQRDQLQIVEDDAVLPILDAAKLFEGTGMLVDTAGKNTVITDASELAEDAPDPVLGEAVTVIAGIAENLNKSKPRSG